MTIKIICIRSIDTESIGKPCYDVSIDEASRGNRILAVISGFREG